ncbi:Hypothetical protein D9617_10g074440 [Elsinoe fawcettii]|nr:Hypothetical protein D9617_10g074440 [Elsinoe fawcettii]
MDPEILAILADPKAVHAPANEYRAWEEKKALLPKSRGGITIVPGVMDKWFGRSALAELPAQQSPRRSRRQAKQTEQAKTKLGAINDSQNSNKRKRNAIADDAGTAAEGNAREQKKRSSKGGDKGNKQDEVEISKTVAQGQTKKPPQEAKNRIAIIGCGTIGSSFVSMHLLQNPDAIVVAYDTRPDIKTWLPEQIRNNVKLLKGPEDWDFPGRLEYAESISAAVSNVGIVQEQGPENKAYKVATWREIEKHAHKNTLLWTSTSGIPASVQAEGMIDKTRLIVCHPYNPPLLMPLIEVVPSPDVNPRALKETMKYWEKVKKKPILIHKEVTGFVANRLAFALLREAVSLVQDGVISVKDLDDLVETSMGPRWAAAGPFKSYHAGGGAGGMEAFLANIGQTVQDCWKASDKKAVKAKDKSWHRPIAEECKAAFGDIDYAARQREMRRVLKKTE